MTIAVSAIVWPSRILFSLVCAMSAMAISIGFAIVVGYVGELVLLVRLAIFSSLFFLVLFGFYHGAWHRKPLHIDISGDGQLRLTKVHVTGSCKPVNCPHVPGSTQVVRLLKDSTIWPQLLLLRLQDDGGKITNLVVLPDCVSRKSFRALSVACRWIAAHNNTEKCNGF